MQPQKSDIDAALDTPIYGARAIAEEAALPGGEKQAFYMLSNGYVDGTKVGRLWVSTRRRIRNSLGIST
jgi:hypothetical protein